MATDELCIRWGALFEAYVFQMFRACSHGANRYPCIDFRTHDQIKIPNGPRLPVKRKRGKATTAKGLPESLVSELRTLLSSPDNAVNPLCMGADRRQASDLPALEAWRAQLSAMDANLNEPSVVPLVFSEFDDKQLEFGRVATVSDVPIPDCCYGKRCITFRVLGVVSPLQAFLTPGEQREVDSSASPVFEPDAACLLCIRHVHDAMHKIRGAMLLNPLAEIGRAQMSVPPFQNAVDQPGGYKLSTMAITPSSQVSLGVHVVGASGALRLARNPLTGREYIDQEALKYRGADF